MLTNEPSKDVGMRGERSEPDADTAIPRSVFLEDLTITGNVTSQGKVQVKGHIRGEIRCTSVVIDASATVDGLVVAEDVTLFGRMNGLIYSDGVWLHSGSRFEGDICHRSMSIEEGAHFDGQSLRSDDPKAMAPAGDATPAQAAPRDDAGTDKGKSVAA